MHRAQCTRTLGMKLELELYRTQLYSNRTDYEMWGFFHFILFYRFKLSR